MAPSKKSSYNPLAFRPTQVTVLTSAVYIALIAVLLWAHLTVPFAPSNPTPAEGVNLTQAWLDLEFVSNGYHPFDSRRNDEVRGYLVKRIEEIVESNGVAWKNVGKKGVSSGKEAKAVTVFAYDPSNVTYVDDLRQQPWAVYGESTSILVYVRGTEDEEGDWWTSSKPYSGKGGVLVNAHFDSVSSGYGATDDGVGVTTVLQLISYFTTPGNEPKRGIVALLNNGEENGLYGAHYYLQHPLSSFAHTFLNLEGAGAGGRATLFRSTDAEVTKLYGKSPRPYGTVISGDGFKQGFIRSGTDYSVFTESLGMRGLDVAFFGPRARYHTNQDDVRDTSLDSVWHMLSASLETMKGLTSYSGDEFEGKADSKGKLDLRSGHTGVYFDLFGRALAVLKLNQLFAVSVTLLTAGPVLLILLEILIAKTGKWYPFSRKAYLHSSDDDTPILLGGFKGFFRFPLAFILSTAAVVALAYLLTKINPYIIYSSEYAVWAMTLSAWFAVSWFFLAGADRIRPSALQRFFCLLWLYVLSWIVLVFATVGENNLKLGSGYFVAIYNAAVFAALLISYLEFFALPTKTKYVDHVASAGTLDDGHSTRPTSSSSRALLSRSRDRASTAPHDGDEDATETTSLLRGRDARPMGGTFATTFSKRRRQQQEDEDEALDATEDPFLTKAYGEEQLWSSKLPQWTWVLQFLLLAPINLVIVGQIALILTTATHQTPADGNAVLPVYLIVAGLAILIMLPLTPFLHRFSFYIPTFLFLVFVGCLVYNLLAFPFSRDARLKYYFLQQLDLEAGKNNVSFIGVDGYVQDIVSAMPSAAGAAVSCNFKDTVMRGGLVNCAWPGLDPNVASVDSESAVAGLVPWKNKTKEAGKFEGWLDYNITTYKNDTSTVTFSVQGKNTKSCRILLDTPASSAVVKGSATDPRLGTTTSKGISQVRLMSRDWDKTFSVNVTWSGEEKAKGQTGKVQCLWSDANEPEFIPAYEEALRFGPVWSAVTKAGDGLVEGFKGFEVR